MNRKLSHYFALGLLVCSTIPAVAHAQAVTSARQTWEYLVVREDNATYLQQLNNAGAQGWELVSVTCTVKDVTHYGSVIGGGGTGDCWYYFKRPK